VIFFIRINSHPPKFIVGKTMFQDQNIVPRKAELENIHMHAYPLIYCCSGFNVNKEWV
jgi:hypothetical protein